MCETTLEGHLRVAQHLGIKHDYPLPLDMRRVTATSLNIRANPSTSAAILGQLHAGDVITVIDTLGDWVRFSGGWAHGSYMQAI